MRATINMSQGRKVLSISFVPVMGEGKGCCGLIDFEVGIIHRPRIRAHTSLPMGASSRQCTSRSILTRKQ